LTTAADVAKAVRRHYGAERDGLGPEWAVLSEFSLQPGALTGRIDLLAIRAWRGGPKGHERHAIEIKVDAGDLRSEVARPDKSAPFVAVTHRFWLAVPLGLMPTVNSLPIPESWGVYAVRESDGLLMTLRQAQRRTPEPMPDTALVEAFRRASRMEARIRDADGDDPLAQVARMRRELAASAAAEARAKTAAESARQRARALGKYLLGFLPCPCHCGQGDVTLANLRTSESYRLFAHVEPTDRPCYSPGPDDAVLAQRMDAAQLSAARP
jgi:hypothetical protein